MILLWRDEPLRSEGDTMNTEHTEFITTFAITVSVLDILISLVCAMILTLHDLAWLCSFSRCLLKLPLFMNIWYYNETTYGCEAQVPHVIDVVFVVIPEPMRCLPWVVLDGNKSLGVR
jgi:hypothetical protein